MRTNQRLHVLSLVTGLLCLGVGVTGALLVEGVLSAHLTQQVMAAVLLVTGTIGLAVAMRHRRDDHT